MREFFGLEERKTNVRTELIAGLTTFLAMAYILFVNPNVLTAQASWNADAGLTWGAVFTATAIAAIAGTLIMGIYANYPVALAPGMGMNALFAFTITAPFAYAFSWKLGFAAILCSGTIFLLLSLSGIRKKVINAIPQDLKYAVGAGIGLFIAFIGLKNSGIVSYDPATLSDPADVIPILGDLSNPLVLLAIIGLVITVILYVLRVRAAVFIGIVVTSIVGIFWRGMLEAQGTLSAALENGLPKLPTAVFAWPEAPKFGAFATGFGDLNWGSASAILTFFVVVFTLLFIDFFDTAGTLVTVGSRCGLINENGELEGSGRALASDATATVVGAIVGTSSTTSYIESLAGIEVGGRTGLTAVFTAMFFFIALFLSPVLSVVTSPVTAPALIFVGILMASQLGKINWENISVAVPAFITILAMPLTYSIATGIAVGFIFYPISMISAKKGKEISLTMYILALVFIGYFIIKTIG